MRISLNAEITPLSKNPDQLSQTENLSNYLMNVMKNQENELGQGVPFKGGESYVKPQEIRNVEVTGEDKVKFGVQKELLKVLFPEGFNLKDIELEGEVIRANREEEIVPISEQEEDEENYISGNLQVKGGRFFFYGFCAYMLLYTNVYDICAFCRFLITIL